MPQPNIILIDTDQQRADTIRAAGADWMITPNLDALAERGVLFRNAFCAAATCVASRACLYSGLYSHTTGVYGFSPFSGRILWMHRLNEAGYRCESVGKTHLNCGDHGFARRIGEWGNKFQTSWHDGGEPKPCDWLTELEAAGQPQPYDLQRAVPDHVENLAAFEWPLAKEWHPDVWVGRKTVEWLNERDAAAEEPFFLHVGFMGPHDPYDPPAEYVALYDDVDIPMPEVSEEERRRMPPELWKSVEAMETHNGLVTIRTSLATPERVRRMRAHYFANVTLIDEQIGRIMETLEARGLTENTIIILTSDHGDNLLDHGLIYKGELYDTVVNVPLIVAGPGIGGERVDTSLVSHMDVAQTIMDYAGAPREDRNGQSLRPLLERGEAHARKYVFSEEARTGLRPAPDLLAMIRSGTHKLIFFLGSENGQLFDLRNDPHERCNVWADPEYSAVRAELTHELLGWLYRDRYTHAQCQCGRT